jgi:hypothetical protein
MDSHKLGNALEVKHFSQLGLHKRVTPMTARFLSKAEPGLNMATARNNENAD